MNYLFTICFLPWNGQGVLRHCPIDKLVFLHSSALGETLVVCAADPRVLAKTGCSRSHHDLLPLIKTKHGNLKIKICMYIVQVLHLKRWESNLKQHPHKWLKISTIDRDQQLSELWTETEIPQILHFCSILLKINKCVFLCSLENMVKIFFLPFKKLKANTLIWRANATSITLYSTGNSRTPFKISQKCF